MRRICTSTTVTGFSDVQGAIPAVEVQCRSSGYYEYVH